MNRECTFNSLVPGTPQNLITSHKTFSLKIPLNQKQNQNRINKVWQRYNKKENSKPSDIFAMYTRYEVLTE